MTYAATDITVTASGATLLDGATVVVEPGEVVAVVGPNGAGKSTLVRTLAGDAAPAAGRVELDGRALAEWQPTRLARQRAVMSTDRQIAFAFTAAEVAMLGRSPHHGGRPTGADRRIVDDLLDAVDCMALADRTYATLSTGERQRIQLARAIAQVSVDDTDGPAPVAAYLLLDEPTSSLDPAHQHRSMQLLRERASGGLGVLAVLHDLDLAAAYADRIVLMRDGRVIESGTPAAVLRPDSLEAVFALPMLVVPHPRLPHPLIVADVGRASDDARLSSGPAQRNEE